MFSRQLQTPHVLISCLAFLLVFPAAGEVAPANRAVPPACRVLKRLDSRIQATDSVSWITPSAANDQAKLDRWCETVGPALFRQPEQPRASRQGRILLVNWNIHVGNGNLAALMATLTAEEQAAGRGEPDFVLLLQEVFRRGEDIPSKIRSDASIPSRISSSAEDIEALAEKLDWWMFYAPSMRNGNAPGAAAEDRGNAILSSLPLEALQAVELPFSVQRRVAVTAIVNDHGSNLRFRVAALHLDTRAPFSRGFVFGAAAARNRQAKWIADSITNSSDNGLSLILGGDLNSYWGPLESSIDTIAKLAAPVDCGANATHTTGFKLDHVFARLSTELNPAPCRRLDSRFESDHYPLVLPLHR